MSLIQLSNAWLSFSDAPLLDHAELTVNANERLCIVGRNGAGKSTLLKILNKELPLDDGQVVYQQSLRIARLAQDPPQQLAGSVFDFVAEGLAEQAQLLKNYHHQLALVSEQPTEQHLQQLSQLQEQLEQQDAWQLETRIDSILNQLNLPADALLANLSGGWLRKAALARALVNQPQVLLLDEPTNHLDIQTIDELEQFLLASPFSIVFISHDRTFISKIATRIVDLDRGKLVSWPDNYQAYLLGKEEELRVEAAQHAEFDKKLAQEESWIRQGIKARRTRNEGRVRALKALRQERRQRRDVMGNVAMTVDSGTRSGKLIFALENVSYSLADKNLITDFSAQVLRGDKIALIGANGCGKTTLLKLLLQELSPTSGTVQVGTQLSVAYFDQHRLTLDLEKSVMDNVADGKQDIEINGRSRHVLGYLQEFLFPPKRSMVPVKALSGGEKNRLLMAKLFLKPSNLLILDEPTNDLDVETLELLEELIANYQGTVLLVSHDRQFVDNIATECWIFAGNGRIERYPGGYQDAWQQHQQVTKPARITEAKASHTEGTVAKEKATKRSSTKLSYQQQRELEQLPQQIESLEQQIEQLQQQIAQPDFFNLPHSQTSAILAQLTQAQQQLEHAFEQWEQLEKQAKAL